MMQGDLSDEYGTLLPSNPTSIRGYVRIAMCKALGHYITKLNHPMVHCVRCGKIYAPETDGEDR